MQKSLVLFFTLFLTGCALIPVYTPSKEQGNVFNEAQIASLKTGMSKRQVLFIMGNPVLSHPANPNRWDYVYDLTREDGSKVSKRVTLFFENDRILEIFQSVNDEKKPNS